MRRSVVLALFATLSACASTDEPGAAPADAATSDVDGSSDVSEADTASPDVPDVPSGGDDVEEPDIPDVPDDDTGEPPDSGPGEPDTSADTATPDSVEPDVADPEDTGAADDTLDPEDIAVPDVAEPEDVPVEEDTGPIEDTQVEEDTSVEIDVCTTTCAPHNACGDDGCGGTCGSCESPRTCELGICVLEGCTPDCVGKECGDNGCLGTCGACSSGSVCSAEGQCEAPCIPDCVGRVCGDDSCGGSCGDCGDDAQCNGGGWCTPNAWTCAPLGYDAADYCHCGCGAADPDCALAFTALVGCDADEVCNAGVCENFVPSSWTCNPIDYGNNGPCDCGCGAPDLDCKNPAAPIRGCDGEQFCSEEGTCEVCVPTCEGKECGTDGCGGNCTTCGQHPDPEKHGHACVNFTCVPGCAEAPVACLTAECGDDGCGGSCGDCDPLEQCASGQCEPEAGASCAGFCKGVAPAGCSCTLGCELDGSCCPDFEALCVCTPACASTNACGPDGCGGSCGTCTKPSAPHCGVGGVCAATCAPQCDGKVCGGDGCGGKCGTCGGGATCNAFGKCVPPTWTCFEWYYGEGEACDCACGAPDPDCEVYALTFGCPSGAPCGPSGLCDVAQCNTRADCKLPRWCVGSYPTGNGLLKGVCQVPNPLGQAAGASCNVDEDCATLVCAGGLCRNPCGWDFDCQSGERCLGLPIGDPLTGQTRGIVAVCDSAYGSGAPCSSSISCGDEQCLVTVDLTTLKALHRCGATPAGAEGAFCFGFDCAPGLVCHNEVCSRPCPSGTADCSDDQSCEPGVLHGGLSTSLSDDVTVPVCTSP